MHIRTIIALLVTVFLYGTAATDSASAQSADAIAQRLHNKYESLSSLRAEFTQTMTSQYSDIRDQKAGTLLLKGDDYRLETGGETYARRGDETWRYSRSENQVIVSDYMDDDGSFSVNDLFFRYDELFDVTDVRTESNDGSRHYRMTLRPKQDDSFFSEVTLWLRDRDDIITRIHMVDLNGTEMDFRLKNVELNPTLAASAFAPPSGAEVVNLR